MFNLKHGFVTEAPSGNAKMNDAQHTAVESGGAIVAKLTPPASVSIATLWGYQVDQLLIWATFIYTILMIIHKSYVLVNYIREVWDGRKAKE